MNCRACGANIAPGSRYCGVCGHSVSMDIEHGADSDVMATNRMVGDRTAADTNRISTQPSGDYLRPQSIVVEESLDTDDLIYPAEPVDPYLGRELNGRFTVESKIGEGGFGAVYRGVQKSTGRKVALKLLHPDVTQDENLVARFRQEGNLMCGFKDAHTVTTYDFDQTEDGTLFIAMELLEGRSLHQVLCTEAPIEWRRMFRIITQMCTSLAEAHSQGVVHRDLKPENIHLEHRPGDLEFVKVLDFGIAKVMQGDGKQWPQLTAMGQTLGTLEYMSPEQLMGKSLDGRSDIYTIGVLAYELLTAQLPFPDAKGPAALITAQLRQVPEPPSRVYREAHGIDRIPPAVDSMILKMLGRDKDARFTHVSALRSACLEVLETGTWRDPHAAAAQAMPTMIDAAPPPGVAVAGQRASSPVVPSVPQLLGQAGGQQAGGQQAGGQLPATGNPEYGRYRPSHPSQPAGHGAPTAQARIPYRGGSDHGGTSRNRSDQVQTARRRSSKPALPPRTLIWGQSGRTWILLLAVFVLAGSVVGAIAALIR